MVAFTKLYSSIIHSSIWAEPHHVRIVWITMLAMSDQDGVVEASVGGLARAAHVTREDCEDALRVLMGPDADSRDGTTGERIEKVPGGFLILNYVAYRERKTKTQEQTAERVRKHRENRATVKRDVTHGNAVKRGVTRGNARNAIQEAEAEVHPPSEGEARVRARTPPEKSPDRPEDVSEQTWLDWLAVRKGKRAKVTATALDGIRREAATAGITLEEALAFATTQGWQGFRADWFANAMGKGGGVRGGPIVPKSLPVGSYLKPGDDPVQSL